MLMSMAAWPSMDPASPLSACSRAAAMRRVRTNSRNATAMSTIMIGPPTNSPRVNCHDSSSARMMPSSMTRLVLAISNAMALMKLAPRRNRARASATAAYEHDEEAAPRPAATASVLGRSSPSSRMTVSRRMTAWITADNVNPRISDQVICQVIDPASARAWPSASTTGIAAFRGGDRQQLPQAVLQQRMREPVGQPVEDHPAVLAEAHQPGQAQHLQRIGDLILSDLQGQRQVSHAQFFGCHEGEQDARAHRVGQHAQQPGEPPGFGDRQHPGSGGGDPLGVDRMIMVKWGHHSSVYPYDHTEMRSSQMWLPRRRRHARQRGHA